MRTTKKMREAEALVASETLADASRPRRRQLEGSIRTGRASADWYAEKGCPRQAAAISARCDEWQRMIDEKEYR